jgi:DUF971 family protein
MKPKTIETVNNFLAIVWEDGQETFVDFETLRRACPCAACKGEANILVAAAPIPHNFTPASFELRSWHYVGGYALQPQWGDGHASGIYSYDYLRRLEAKP